MNWPRVLKSKLMLEIGVTVSVAVELRMLPAQLDTVTATCIPLKAKGTLEIVKEDAVAPVTFTPFVRHW